MSAKAKIGILGASGYTGAELVRLLIRHPQVDIVLLTADRRAGKAMADVFPQFSPYPLPILTAVDDVDWPALGLDLVFCALPHGTTQTVIKALLARLPAIKIVDLSADFRLADPAAYERWYGHAHAAPELQAKAVYGLTEIYRAQIKAAQLVANPGCYTSCAELALIPLLKAKAIDPDEIVIDAKSGVTGAGRGAREDMQFAEVSEGFHAYSVGRSPPHVRARPGVFQGRRARGDRDVYAASGADKSRHPVDDLRPRHEGVGAGPSCDTVKVLRETSRSSMCCRSAPSHRPAMCAAYQHDLHRRRRRPHRRPCHHRLGARQSDQGRSGQAVPNMNLPCSALPKLWGFGRWRCFRDV